MPRTNTPVDDKLEHAIEEALRPCVFVNWRNTSPIVVDLDEVKGRIDTLAAKQPARAASLYEVFIAACTQKAEEFDDSDGELGMFVGSLFVAWVRAKQGARAKSAEIVDGLLWWIDHDDYGFAHQLEKGTSKVLDEDGLAAFVDAARRRLADAPAEGADSWKGRHWTGVLRTLLAAQRDVPALIAHCEATGLTGADCESIGEILASRRRREEALAWVERGLALQAGDGWRSSGAGWHLADLKRTLLQKLGRADEAVASAWSEFEARPDELSYETLMKQIARGDRAAWHARAMKVADRADLRLVISLLVKTKETDRLADRVRAASDADLEGMSHYTTEPVAAALERGQPGLAARVYRGLGIRILSSKKSKYYDAALAHFERARDCCLRAGDQATWGAIVREVRGEHSRKTGFMPGLEKIVAGNDRRPPSFLEQAKKRQRPDG